MTNETNINVKRVNECRFHPDCEGCKLDILRNGFNKSCYELIEEEVVEILEKDEVNNNG